MAEVLKKFGRYFLLDQIAQGGMAEIYRARLAAVDGAGRLLVIKRIQAGYGENNEFLQMFKSEIKVTMGFNHPNIVQLYDFGEENAQPFIAMEFVDGKNLRQFMNRFNESKKPFSVELAVHIIEQAACGLHYAHTFKDKISGEHLNIVHRDISPQNILISYEGNVKVIDFGIAKAATNIENTRAGVIKGKPSYLSPEQITGEVLDGRCDIFALGIVVWEVLVGRKLFAGDNDLAVLKLIESCNTHIKPPSTFNQRVPKELDAIVMKALAKNRDKRYQTAEEMQRALHRFLYAFAPEFNPADLEYTAKELFKQEIVDDRKKIQRLNDEAEKLLVTSNLVIHQPHRTFGQDGNVVDGTGTLMEPAPSSTGSREAWDSDHIRTGVVQIDASAVQLASTPPQQVRPKRREPLTLKNPAPVGIRQRTASNIRVHRSSANTEWMVGLGKLGAIAAAIIGAVVFVGPSVRNSVPFLSRLLSGRSTQVADSSGSGEDHSMAPPPVVRANPPARYVSSLPPGVKSVGLRLNIVPKPDDLRIIVNGKDVDPGASIIPIPLDAPVELIIDGFGFRPVTKDFVLSADQMGTQKETMMDVLLDKLPTGFLTIKTSTRARAILIKDGHERKTIWTSFERLQLPVGEYTVRIIHDALGWERTLSLKIKEGELTWPFDNAVSRELSLHGDK